MTLENLMNIIIEDAKKEAENIIKEANKNAEQIIEDSKKNAVSKALEEEKDLIRKAKEEAENIRNTILSEARIKSSWMIINEKTKIIDEAIEKTKEKLKEFTKSKEKYMEILSKLIINAGSTLGGGELEILLNKQDLKLPLDIKKLEKIVEEKTGKKTIFKIVDEDLQTIGGVIVRTKDQKIIINYTFEGLIESHKRYLQKEASKILFSE
jgi:V/A-type H+-transporting ATPase subunit E